MYEASAIAESREGKMYATLPLQTERLFPQLEPMTSKFCWRSLTIAPRSTKKKKERKEKVKGQKKKKKE